MNLQELLDQEAALANAGKGKSKEREKILTLIKIARDERYRPPCFGEDDCSTEMLMRCPWRIDCGGEY